jgi:phage-related protein
MANKKSIDVRFYADPESESKNEPVRDWLRKLPEEERVLVGADIRIVQNHWPNVQQVKPKLIDHLRDDVWEVRTSSQDHWLRVLFGFFKGEMILLHATKKKTNKTQNSDIDIAQKRFNKLKNYKPKS